MVFMFMKSPKETVNQDITQDELINQDDFVNDNSESDDDSWDDNKQHTEQCFF